MIVITGGSGFIGSALSEFLRKKGHRIRVIDLVAPKQKEVEYSCCSVLDFEATAKALKDAQAVVHLAALIDVRSSISNPLQDFQVNALGTLNVLEAARKNDIQKVIFASSAAVYGNPVQIPISESHQTAPISPYGASKLAAEGYVNLYSRLYGMKNCTLRLFNVYGRGQGSNPYAGVIAKFAKAINEGRPPTIYGDGKQSRDFIHIEDVCNAFFLALKSDGCPPINIGTGKETTLLQLLEIMQKITKKKIEPVFAPAQEGEIKRSVADCRLAKEKIGFIPKISIQEGIATLF
ncbi:MAG: NAD-dependent epimerase/dehydratase family protein [Candidatus Micrarchaeota archaeon]|nr:NAD-dependent epimerase/dehydratase family protein [Candidatus Micrarchaeota archaeon]